MLALGLVRVSWDLHNLRLMSRSPHLLTLSRIIRAIVVSRYTHYKYITGCDEWSIGMRWVKTV